MTFRTDLATTVSYAQRAVRRAAAGLLERRSPSDLWLLAAGSPRKRALLSYRTRPFLFWPLSSKTGIRRNHADRNAIRMVRALNDIGYAVDLVSFSNTRWLPRRRYDLFIGHGGINFSRISERLGVVTRKIYFSTGIEWREFNRREEARFRRLSAARGVSLPGDRYIVHSEDAALTDADGIICLGNNLAAATYNAHPMVIGIDNTVRETQWTGWRGRDYAAARNRFLFFSGGGSVHKGLDLLLEAFQDSRHELHICHHMDSGFASVFKHELSASNIHVHGFVRERSKQFIRLAAECNWVITASCAEGQPGSVLECMAHGLVPILPSAANIDPDDFALLLDAEDPRTIRVAIDAASLLSPDECRRRTEQTVEATKRRFTEQAFQQRFAEAVQTILKIRDHCGGSAE